jgi:hypothetical protein
VLQGFDRRLEFFQNAFVKDALRQCKNLRVIRLEKVSDVRRFRFRGVDPIIK